MFTDIVGFSKKLADNESKAFELLKTHDALIRVLTTKFDGKIIRSLGDSFIIDFSNTVNAVKCAIEVQKRLWNFNRDKSESNTIKIRIGIHVGEVMFSGEEVLGEGVTISSRIEALTGPNRICISLDVYNQVRSTIPLQVFDMGVIELKDVASPMEVYEILIDSIPELAKPSPSAQQASTSQKSAAQREAEELHEAKRTEEVKQRIITDQLKAEAERKKKIAAHYTRAEKYFESGELEKAEDELDKIAKLDPQLRLTTEKKQQESGDDLIVQEHLDKAREFLANEDFNNAEAEINEIFRILPLHVGAQQLLLLIEEKRYIHEENKRTEQIATTVHQMSDDERKVNIFLEQARTLLQEENFQAAIFTLRDLFLIDPNNSTARRLEEKIRQAELEKSELLRVHAEDAAENQHLLQLALLQKKVEEQRKQSGIPRTKYRESRYKILNIVAIVIIVLAALVFGMPRLIDILFPKKASIAILRFTNAPRDTSYSDLFDALPVLLAEDFARCKHVTVISPSSSLLYIPDRALLGKIASLIPAEYFLIGTIQEDRGKYTILIRLVIPGIQRIAYVGTIEGTLASLNEIRTKILQQVLERMEIKSSLPEISQPTNLNAFTRYLKGIHLMQLKSEGIMDSAISVLRSSIQVDPTLGVAYGSLAEAEFQLYQSTFKERHLRSAIDYAQQALRNEYSNASALRVLAEYQAYNQNYIVALSYFSQALTFHPHNADCYRGLTRLALIAGKYEDAVSYATQALSLDPKNPDSHFTNAIAQHMIQNYSLAEKSYNQALMLGEDDSTLTSNYIQKVWVGKEKYKTIVQYCRQVIQKSPEDYRYYYWLGRAYQLLLQVKPAQEQFETGLRLALRSVEMNPKDAFALAYTGLFYSRLGKFAEGESAIKRTIQIDSSDSRLLFLQANIYSIQRNKQKTLQAIDNALQHRYDLAALLDPDLSYILREPEYLSTIARSIDGSWPSIK
jgi:tetratricopeptide (TPR) repeat protein